VVKKVNARKPPAKMPKSTKAKPAPKRAAPARKAPPPPKKAVPARKTKTVPARAPPAKPSRAPAKAAPAPKPSTQTDALAARMAAFSQKVQTEEETPVAVRSWSEAKAEKPASKQLLPKTGEVTPAEVTEEEPEIDLGDDGTEAPETEETAADEEPDEEEEETRTPPPPSGKPQMNPLTGPQSVPKDHELEFEVATRPKIKKAGKGGERPEEFGPVELRQATASGGRHLTRALPENLQRGAERIQPLATPPDKKKKLEPERFEVSMDKRAGPNYADLAQWGDVEIGQQTLSGSRSVGKLSPQEEAQRRREEEERKRGKK